MVCIAGIADVENLHASYLRRRRWPASNHLAGPPLVALRRRPALASAARACEADIADPAIWCAAACRAGDSIVCRWRGAAAVLDATACGWAPLHPFVLSVSECPTPRGAHRPTARWSVWSTPLPLQPRAICTPRDAQNMYIDVNGY